MPRSDRILDRAGALCGVASVALLLWLLIAAPSLPAPDHPIGEIASRAQADSSSLLRGAYLGTLVGVLLIAFGASLAAALRRAEGDGGGWWIVSLAAVSATSVGIVGDVAVVTFVRAVGHGVQGDVLWLGYGADHWAGTLVAAPLGLFVLAASVGAKVTRLLPGWLTWGGLAVGPALVVGAASVVGNETDGGALGVVLFFGYLLGLVWIVSSSVCLWRAAPAPRAEGALAVRTVS